MWSGNLLRVLDDVQRIAIEIQNEAQFYIGLLMRLHTIIATHLRYLQSLLV